MRTMTGSRFLAEAMEAYGVSHVFIVPTIVTPALAEMGKLGVTRVTTHAEKAAVYMADGYARVSGRVGVCGAQTIGASNLAAGLRDPFMACSPVIALTGGRFSKTKYRHVYQEIDDFAMFEPVTKFNAQVDEPGRIADLLRQAFRSATTGCPGPVHLEIGGNFAQAIEGEAELDGVYEPAFGRVPACRPAAERDLVRKAVEVLASAERAVIVAGGGVVASGAQSQIVRLAAALNIPVATSLSAKGTIREDHRLSVGVVGLYSRPCANRVVSEADLVFYVGSRTGSQVTNGWKIPRPAARVMQLDIAGEALGRNYPNVVSLCGDAKTVLGQMLEGLPTGGRDDGWALRAGEVVAAWRAEVASARCSDAQPIRPERLCAEVQGTLGDDAILVSDTGHAGIWTAMHVELQHPGQTYIRAAGSLGWALPAAMGAKCAAPDRPVIAFTGDGGFYYHMSELETAVRYGLNVVIVVNNNYALSQEMEIFEDAYGGRQNEGFEMWQFTKQDLAGIARSMGCFGERVTEPDRIRGAMERALGCGKPAVVDVVTDVDVLGPLPWS